MEKNSKIYVAGHHGLVGSAIWKTLKNKGYTNVIGRTLSELDLMDTKAVANFFTEEKPEYVFWLQLKLVVLLLTTLIAGNLFTKT